MTVQGGNFSAATVYLAGNYSSILTGNQVFITHTLNAGGNVTSNVSGNASGPINSSGTVSLNIGGNLNGNVTAPKIGVTSGSVTNSALTGTNVTVTSGTVASTIINASGQGTVNANTIDGQFNGGTFTLTATNHVNATVNANTVSLVSPTGTVKGTWTTLDTGTNGSLAVNGETRVGNGKAGPNQIVVEGFALPAGSAVTASGQLILPQGVVIGLLTPAGASGKPRIVLVHSVRMLGQLLSDGYTAIVIDLNNHKDRSIHEVKLASN